VCLLTEKLIWLFGKQDFFISFYRFLKRYLKSYFFKTLRGVWFGCFLFSFSLKTENGDENLFGWISENIFSENENRKQPANENNKFSFPVFSVENRNLISGKMKLR